MRALVFVNGKVDDYDALQRWVEPGDLFICADGGVEHCLRLKLTPDAIVGDMDSVDPVTLRRLERSGVAVERHPPEKDQTDLELAMDRALRDGATELWILGALGGRLDQTLANVLILAHRKWPVPVMVADGNQVASLLQGGETVTLRGQRGSVVSLIPLSEEVTGIDYEGLEYDLTDYTLPLGSTRAVSNVVAETPATISIGSGMALVIQTL